MVGYAQDAFDIGVIEEEFKRRYNKQVAREEEAQASAATDKNEEEDEIMTKPKKVELGKHYMVFMAQTWTSKTKPFCFVAARYCLANLSGRWIRVNKRQITSTLAFFGIIVNTNSFDGATENRSALNQDLTIPLSALIPDLKEQEESTADEMEDDNSTVASVAASVETESDMPRLEEINAVPEPDTVLDFAQWLEADTKRRDDFDRHPGAVVTPPRTYKQEDLPWDMMVAYPHPTLEGRIIIAAADMPHAIKKQVNALELSSKAKSKRDLHLNGLPIHLKMGFDAYKQSDDFKHEGAIMRYPKLNIDTFQKTSKSRMRFGLAARSLGDNMIRCIQNNENQVTKATPRNDNLISAETGLSITSPATYDSYLLLAHKTNRFIDIMNGNRDKGCSLIDSPIHPHVFELLEYVKFLTHWKAQSMAANNRYLYFKMRSSCWS